LLAEPDWTAYLSLVTGIVGAVSGISGAVMGFISLRRSSMTAAADFRLDLRNLERGLANALPHTERLMHVANQSRQIVSAAIGSGAVMKWDEDFERDKHDLKETKRLTPLSTTNYDALDDFQLKSKLDAARKFEELLIKLNRKYPLSIATDGVDRKQVSQNLRRPMG
jgi:hypothetical protein